MLDKAQKYKKEVDLELLKFFLKKNIGDNFYYYGNPHTVETRLEVPLDGIWQVSLNKDRSFNGIIRVTKRNKRLEEIGILPFDGSNSQLMKDTIDFFYRAYTTMGIEEIKWFLYSDAPFYAQARRAAERFGKPIIEEVTPVMLKDGRLHRHERFILEKSTIDFSKVENFLRIE